MLAFMLSFDLRSFCSFPVLTLPALVYSVCPNPGAIALWIVSFETLLGDDELSLSLISTMLRNFSGGFAGVLSTKSGILGKFLYSFSGEWR